MNGYDKPYVLYVDDDDVSRETFELFFQSVGWTYDIAPSGRTGIDAALNAKYDVIITDLTMPDCSGFDLLEQVRRHNPNQAVMVVTGLGTFDDVVKSLREGAVDFFQKPVDFRFLEESVRRVHSCLTSKSVEAQLVTNIAYHKTDFSFEAHELAKNEMMPPIIGWLTESSVIDTNTRLKIMLSFQEALTNAVEHGCLELQSEWKEEFDDQGLDTYSKIKRERLEDEKYANRLVTISSEYDDGELTLSITDGGKGFMTNEIRVVKQDGQMLESFGRGLALMAGNMDELFYSDHGRTVTLKIRLK